MTREAPSAARTASWAGAVTQSRIRAMDFWQFPVTTRSMLRRNCKSTSYDNSFAFGLPASSKTCSRINLNNIPALQSRTDSLAMCAVFARIFFLASTTRHCKNC